MTGTWYLYESNIKINCLNSRLTIFKRSLQKAFSEQRAQSLSLTRVRESVNTEQQVSPFSQGEITAALNQMTEDNQIMLSDGIVFLI